MENEQQESGINLVEYLLLLLSKWWIIVIATLVCAGAMFAYTKFIATPMYKSDASIYILQKAADTQSDVNVAKQLTKDYERMIKGRRVLEEVIANLNLNVSYGDLKNMVTITNPTDTRILEITVSGSDPMLVHDIADEVCEVSVKNISEIMQGKEIAQISETASTPKSPYSPNTARNVLIGLIVGFVATCGVFFLVFFFDDKIKNPGDVEKYLGLSTLGMIPEAKKIEDRK